MEKEACYRAAGDVPDAMIHPNQSGLLNSIGKWAAPLLSRRLLHPRFAPYVRLLETYLAILQGKGSGSRWDLGSEVAAAASLLPCAAPVVFDVGANRGEWSQRLRDCLGSDFGRLFMIEPSPDCLPALRTLSFANTTIIPAAVGDRPGTSVLYSETPGSPHASLHIRRDTYHRFVGEVDQQPVYVTTIDRIMEQFAIESVDFMKLDVEGHELAALQGAQRALAARSILAFAFEFGSGNLNSRTYMRDFWDLLYPLGYALFRIAPTGILLPIREYYEDLEYFRGVTNYIAMAQPD